MSIDVALLDSVGGAISDVAQDYQWLEVGDTVDDVVAELLSAVESWYSPMNIGMVASFLGSLPDAWLPLDGSTYDALDYPELFDALDSRFKDIGEDEFTLPDLGGLFPLCGGDGYLLGDAGGSDAVSLSVAEMPAHSHNYTFPVVGAMLVGVGAPLPVVDVVTPSTPTSSAGSGDAHENMPPYFTLVMGIFCGRS